VDDELSRRLGERNHIVIESGDVVVPNPEDDVGRAVVLLKDAHVVFIGGGQIGAEERFLEWIAPGPGGRIRHHNPGTLIFFRKIEKAFAVAKGGIGRPATREGFANVGHLRRDHGFELPIDKVRG
jgi:hypothetical protein